MCKIMLALTESTFVKYCDAVTNSKIIILSICSGDAELVILFDPLAMLNDSNPCNNFIRHHVHVDCTMTSK